MKRILSLFVALLPLCQIQPANAFSPDQIIPLPAEISTAAGEFNIKGAKVYADAGQIGENTGKMVAGFVGHLGEISGSALEFTGKASDASIVFEADKTLGEEAYCLVIEPAGMTVRASSYNGFLYAIQSIRQMLPTSVYGKAQDSGAAWTLPCCTIKDSPRFVHRCFHLDCCRHFWSLDEVKKCIDIFACYKLNRFHWHLTDDQGWRIEIKKYPRLTEVGAWRNGTMIGRDFKSNDGIRYGGYYTQDQVRELVAYAAERGITVIPEIELPGHMQAALAAYPELGCELSQPQPYEVWTKWGISPQVLCVGKESTMKFLEDVVCEVADLFPGEYFHIGGDECPRTEWAADAVCQAKIKELGLVGKGKVTAEDRLQNYVTERIQKVLATKGKKIIGWDEILEGELAEGATVMSWRGSKGGIKAASMGYDVIMSPNTYCYFDYSQSKEVETEPLGIIVEHNRDMAIDLEKVYGWDPCQGIAPEYQSHIIGAQANLWTEYIATTEHLEYMILPRLMALSEVQWCAPSTRDLTRLKKSIAERQFPILRLCGYNFRDKGF